MDENQCKLLYREQKRLYYEILHYLAYSGYQDSYGRDRTVIHSVANAFKTEKRLTRIKMGVVFPVVMVKIEFENH